MDYGFSFLSFTEIADDVAYAEKKVSPTRGYMTRK